MAGLFVGTHYPLLDDKGRLVLPARFREALAEGLMIRKGPDGCLDVYTPEGFTRASAKMLAGTPATPHERAVMRDRFASAFDQVPDKQGRITIPADLRGHAGLSRDCVVAGVGDHLEIWDAARWTAFNETYADVVANPPPEVIEKLL